MRLNYVFRTLCPGRNSAAILASKSWPRRPREPHRQREPQDNADRQRGHRRLRRLLEAHAVPVDDDEAQRLGRHAAAHALDDETVASPQSEARLRYGNDGPVSIDDGRTEHG